MTDTIDAPDTPDTSQEGKATLEVATGHDESADETRTDATLLDKVQSLETERDALKEQLLRVLAETENVRKRANRQIADERVYAVEKFARDILAVSDNLARALSAVPADVRGLLPETARNLIDGVELTQKELHSVLARHGVTVIEAAPGTEFDPALHQAVTQIPSDQASGLVVETFQSGWRIGERTLRPAMVAVSSGPG
ncbi:MAG: nucleotide exchange factor GrpE [Alphaproteobacteria bacterium]|nr:nucleotide exchange factor GrpE [Alphaproteobacteria bacterium]